tara:strand:+ start:418 stop:1257 length:840 start_codon:yes stop_codon:yes gene_type:complete
LGYESTNALILLGSLGLVIVFYIIQVLIFFAVLIPLRWWKPQSVFIQNQYRNLKQNLFFGQLLAIAITGYMEFLIAGYYTITYGLTSTSGEVISNYTAYFALIVTCILMPLAILFIIVQRRRDLHRYRIYNVLGELYAGFKTSDRINLTYYLLFGIRRVMYIYVVFNWVEDSWAQAMVIMFMNLFMLIFIGQQKPLSRMFKNRIELFNEFCVLIITIHMICFTEWVPGRQERDVMGWSMIAIIGFNIAINVKSIFKVIYHGFKLVCIRYKNHAKAYFKK